MNQARMNLDWHDTGSKSGIAAEIGHIIQKMLDNGKLLESSLKISSQVRTLVELDKCAMIDGENVYLDPYTLVPRLFFLLEKDVKMWFRSSSSNSLHSRLQISRIFKWERRAEKKSDPWRAWISASKWHSVLDGDALLHRVKWLPLGIYSDVVVQYLRYVKGKYLPSSIIFIAMQARP